MHEKKCRVGRQLARIFRTGDLRGEGRIKIFDVIEDILHMGLFLEIGGLGHL